MFSCCCPLIGFVTVRRCPLSSVMLAVEAMPRWHEWEMVKWYVVMGWVGKGRVAQIKFG
jgi:hypothetical protein